MVGCSSAHARLTSRYLTCPKVFGAPWWTNRAKSRRQQEIITSTGSTTTTNKYNHYTYVRVLAAPDPTMRFDYSTGLGSRGSATASTPEVPDYPLQASAAKVVFPPAHEPGGATGIGRQALAEVGFFLGQAVLTLVTVPVRAVRLSSDLCCFLFGSGLCLPSTQPSTADPRYDRI